MELQTISIGHNQPSLPGLIGGQPWPETAAADDVRPLAGAAPTQLGEQVAAEGTVGTVVWLSWLRGRYGHCDVPGLPDLDRALINPAAVFGSPDEVVRHPRLTLDCKREILWRWAWDEYLLDLANADGMPGGAPSRLPEVKAALRLLNSEWSPDPAAPAAYIVRYDRHGLSLAA